MIGGVNQPPIAHPGPQVQRRGEGRGEPDPAVPEPLVADPDRGEDEGQRGGGHDVIHADLRLHALPVRPLPEVDVPALDPDYVLSRRVARRADGHSLEDAAPQVVVDPRDLTLDGGHRLLEVLAERSGLQEGASRRCWHLAAGKEPERPPSDVPAQGGGIGAEDPLGRRLHHTAADPHPGAVRALGDEGDPHLAGRGGDGLLGGVRGGGAEEERRQAGEEQQLQGGAVHGATRWQKAARTDRTDPSDRPDYPSDRTDRPDRSDEKKQMTWRRALRWLAVLVVLAIVGRLLYP